MRAASTGGVVRLAAGISLLLSTFCVLPAGAAAPTLADIEICMRANVPAALQVREFSLISSDKSGAERTLKGRLFAQRENGRLRSMMKVEAPLDLRGAAYLLRESDGGQQDAMYVFLPALNKTRRIVGGSQDSPMFGTDISYADIKHIHSAFVAGSVTIEKTETYAQRDTTVLALKPDAQQQSQFTLIRSWIDRKSCVALRADFLHDDQLRKRYVARPEDLRQSGVHWYAESALVEDLIAGSKTRIQLSGVKSPPDLPSNYFNPRSFQLAN